MDPWSPDSLEKQKLQEAFKHVDKDKNGTISYDELVQVMKSEGVKDIDKMRSRLVKQLSDGIEFEEFYSLVQR